MNVHEERAWKLLLELGAKETALGGKHALDLSPIRVTSGNKLGLLVQAVVDVVGRSGANRRHVDRRGCPIYVVTDFYTIDPPTKAECAEPHIPSSATVWKLPVRIPNEGEKITHRPPMGTTVYFAVRAVRRRIMGSREEARHEAELRSLVGDAYVTVGRLARTTVEAALAAARALAARRGWIVDDKRLGWSMRDASYIRGLGE